jgi:hypothetical protein
VGIKDGKPFRYTGKVAADHYDHVHVALDTGRAGVGDGIGRARTAMARTGPAGDGIGVAVDAARRAGFSGTDLVNMVAIAGRESGWIPTKHNLNPRTKDDSWGLWQINVRPEANPQYRSWKLTDPYVNAKAARQLFKASGYRPWHGFTGVTKDMFAKARAAVTGSRRGAAAKKGGKRGSNIKGGAKAHAIHSNIAGPLSDAAQQALNDQRLAELQHQQDISSQGAEMPSGGGGGDTGSDPTQELADAIRAQIEALNSVRAELKRQTDFATSIANTSNFQLTKNLADLISGQIVGRGVAGRAFTPGTGVEHAY